MQATAKRVEEVVENIKELSDRFGSERHERQRRRALDIADFDALTDAGFHLTGAPARDGGYQRWRRRIHTTAMQYAAHPGEGRPQRLACRIHAPCGDRWLAGSRRSSSALHEGVERAE